MKKMFTAELSALLLYLSFTLSSRAAEFVALTTEIEICDWDYLFFSDRLPKSDSQPRTSSIFTPIHTNHCVIGVDTWKIETSFPTFDETVWFTGTNILVHTAITGQPTNTSARIAETTQLAVGHRYTKVHDSLDGNPGRPGGVADLMSFNLAGRISWLAFCSSATLKHEGRRIYPPSSMWKESNIYYSGWTDSTETFQDTLGLPRNTQLIANNGQPIFQYQVRQTTNILGWHIPTEFYGVQYLPTATNGWKLHLTFKGKATSIETATKPEIPPIVLKTIEK
jgi:hypothetical protein